MPIHRESVHAGHTIAAHANLQGAAKWLGCRLDQAPKELQRALATATVTNPKMLQSRQATIQWMRQQHPKSWNTAFEEVQEMEDDLVSFFKDDSKDKTALEDDALAQLSFQSDFWKPLNYIPFALTAIMMFKVWVVPTMAILTPIIAWVMPYILLKFVWALPIQQDEYNSIIQNLMSGNILNRNPITGGDGGGGFWNGRSVTQMIIFGGSFLQSLIQPIQTAMHLYKTDKVFSELGTKLVRLSQITQNLRNELKEIQGPQVKLSHALDTLPAYDPRAAFFIVKEQPERLTIVLRDLARLEILWRISQKSVLRPIRFDSTRLELKGVVDISLSVSGIPSSVLLKTEQPHAVLTGPNGGGKSSFMRAALQSVLLGRSYGVAPAASATMPYFSWIASGLQLRDTPGKLSMFETEVKFAADVLATRRHDGPGLVLFDELFHSTNPPDGIRTAKRFLDGLWNRPDIFSVVSTHVYDLIESAPKTVQSICCKALRVPGSNDILYYYAVEPGICKVSSVDKVWAKFGLRPTSPGQTLESEEKHAD